MLPAGSPQRPSSGSVSSSSGPSSKTGNGVVVSLVDPDGARSMFPDRGVARLLEPDELDAPWLACDHLHVSGYALLAEPVVRAAVRAIDLARASGARISIDLSSWSAIRDAGAERFRALVESLEPDVVFANEDEDAVVRRAARRRDVDPQARRRRVLLRRRRAGGARGAEGRRHDGRRRRARGGLDPRRPRPGARGGCTLRAADRVDALSAAPAISGRRGPAARTSSSSTSRTSASTMIRASSSQCVVAFHPSTASAFDGSPSR